VPGRGKKIREKKGKRPVKGRGEQNGVLVVMRAEGRIVRRKKKGEMQKRAVAATKTKKTTTINSESRAHPTRGEKKK